MLDPIADKDIIDRLTISPTVKSTSLTGFEVYKTPDGSMTYCSKDGVTFYGEYPYIVALDSANSANVDIINSLILNTYHQSYSIPCAAYRDGSDNIYYTYDKGKSYFTSLSDPDGTKIKPGISLTLSPIDDANIVFDYYFYEDPITQTTYYKKFTSDDFLIDPIDTDSILDKNIAADAAIINRLVGVPYTTHITTYHNLYKDPITDRTYYSYKFNSTDKFVTDMHKLEDIALDSVNAADKVIIDRLIPVPKVNTYDQRQKYPDKYLIFKDIRTDKFYYNFDWKWMSNPSTPSNQATLLDENDPTDKAIIDNLQPITTQVTRTETVERIIDGETHTVEGYYSVYTQEAVQKALPLINDAIIQKDKIRAHLGALQNRLENTVSNLNIQAENLQAAESRISDVDVATEMTNFVRNQILTQSATAMLSQANNMPQMMMQLIGG